MYSRTLLSLASLLSYYVVSTVADCAAISSSCSATAITSYCSSYLSIPVSTSYLTGKKTDKTTSTYTISYYTTTYTVTSSGTACPTPPFKRDALDAQPVGMEKRQRSKKPACLSAYKSASAISSACSCVSVKQSTTTITTRSTSTTYKYTQITTDLTTTKTLIPAPTCSTVPANASYDLSEYFSGCGFNRPVASTGGCVSAAKFDGNTTCEAIQGCAKVAADHFAFPDYTTFELLIQPQGNNIYCYICAPTDDGADAFSQQNSPWITVYGYQ